MGQRIGTFLGVCVHLPCLVGYLNNNRIKVGVNCHHFIPFQKCKKNKFMFGKLHCFFLENIKVVLNF